MQKSVRVFLVLFFFFGIIYSRFVTAMHTLARHSCVEQTFADFTRNTPCSRERFRNVLLKKMQMYTPSIFIFLDFVKCISSDSNSHSRFCKHFSHQPRTRYKPVSATAVLNRVLTAISEALWKEVEPPAVRRDSFASLFNLLPGRVSTRVTTIRDSGNTDSTHIPRKQRHLKLRDRCPPLETLAEINGTIC